MGDSIEPEMLGIVGVLLAVILASGYLIIYNIFYIQVFQDIRHYGLLKTIGMTGKQLKKLVRRQAAVLSLYGIPIGLAGGAFAGKLLLPSVMRDLNFSNAITTQVELKPWIFLGAAVFSYFVVYLSCSKPCEIASNVTPVEAVSYTEGQEIERKKKKRKQKHTKKVTPHQIAIQNLGRNRKKVVVVVLSLSMALVLLNSIYSLVSGFDMDAFAAMEAVSDFSVADATLDNVSIAPNLRVLDGVTGDFLQELEKQQGIKEIGNIYHREMDMQFSDTDVETLKKNMLTDGKIEKDLMEYWEEDPEMAEYFIQLLREEPNVLKEAAFLDTTVYGIGKLVMEKLESPNGTLDWEKFKTGDYIIVSRFGCGYEGNPDRTEFFKPGDTVTLENANGKKKTYQVMATAYLPYACVYQAFGTFNCNFILPEQEYLSFFGAQQPMRTLFNVQNEQESEIEHWMSQYCTNVNPNLKYKSKAKIVEEFDSLKQMYTLVGGLFALVLGLIGILNFINTMVTSVLSRKKEFAMMEAVGMTQAQQKKTLQWEGFYYAIFTGIVSVSLAAVLNGTVIRLLQEEINFFSWRFTVTPVLISLAFLVVVVLVVPLACYKNISKVSVVERMRHVE